MGCVRQAVLEFDEEVQVPWRPRLVPVVGGDEPVRILAQRPQPSRRSPSRVGACRPGAVAARTAASPSPSLGPGVRVPGVLGVSGRPAQVGTARRGRPTRARVRFTRRARRLAVGIAVAAGVALGSWLAPILAGGEGQLRLAGVESVVVQPGDTVWSIAGSLDGEGDVRAVVDAIQRLNGLDGASLVPGQVLVLP